MNIFLTNHANVRNTKFCNAEEQVLYKSETIGSTLSPNKKTIISKVVPNESLDAMADHFKELAVIQWSAIASSILTHNGVTVSMKDFMPHEGTLMRHRVFTPPNDSRSFSWTTGVWTLRLDLNDGSKTAVARSHRSDAGIFSGKPRQARLEIFPGFEHLVDIILITYIYAASSPDVGVQSASTR